MWQAPPLEWDTKPEYGRDSLELYYLSHAAKPMDADALTEVRPPCVDNPSAGLCLYSMCVASLASPWNVGSALSVSESLHAHKTLA